jgi:ABC-type bacteriocin/lantibiotic exporters, contain an N-terminal double-glycine peptidase domain
MSSSNKVKDNSKSLFFNIKYFTKLQGDIGKISIINLILLIPITLGISFTNIYLPKLVVSSVLNYNSVDKIISNIFIFGFFTIILKISDTVIESLNYPNLMKYIRAVMLKKNDKNFKTDYANTETAKYRHLSQRADEALWAIGSSCALTDFPKQICELLTNIFGLLLFGTMMLFINPHLTLVLIIAPLFHFFIIKSIQKQQNEMNEFTASIDRKQWYIANTSGSFSAGKDIRIYGLNKWFTDAFKQLTNERLRLDKKFGRKYFFATILELGTILLRDGLAYTILIGMFFNDSIKIDEFILGMSIIGSFATVVSGVLNKTLEINKSNFLINDLREFLEYPDKIQTVSEKTIIKNAPSIKISNLCYRFSDSDENTINSINLNINSCEKIAIVGLNGAGKTTLIKNICGLYMPTEGNVKIDDKSSTLFNKDYYFELFSVVFQDFYFLPESIAMNVACCEEANIDKEKVRKCIELAGLIDKINQLELNVETPLNKQVNKNGTELSEGEQQRLLLARALYKDSPILILDEPTSALDPIAEDELYQKYNELTKNKTSIFISHRLASTRFCDRIVCMESGEIVEIGTHSELMELGGKYYELFSIQSQYYKENDSVK